jgi:hypothetical protein
MAYQIYAGSTSQTVRFFIQDTSVTTGAGLTGLTHSTSGLTCYYSKGIGAATSITLASQTATGAYASGGFCAVDGTNMPGLYRLDLPDVVVDTEAEVIVMLRGAANMAPVAIRITAKKLQTNAVTVADKTGYSLTQSFPANFATLGINSSGHVSRVTLVDTTTVNTDMRGTDGAALASAWTATRAAYLDSVLLAANSNRTVQVTGSNHVAADIHELQTAVITADKFAANWLTAAGTAADYITELQTAIGTATDQTAIKVVTDRINTGLVADGAVYQFTANMLENAPGGGGGGAGDASQATLLEVQDTVESIAASLSGVPITATGRIADGGSITLYCGDDLRVRSGSQITITVSDVGGSIYTRLDGIGEANLFWGASRRGLPASAISGSIASLSQSGSGASQTMTVVVEIDNAGASLQPAEDYTWQIESQQDYGTETDSLIEMEGILALRRRVV